MKRIIFHFSILMMLITSVYAHDDNEERIKFWKEYYNPKVEVKNQSVPSVKITLIKNKPFYQVRTEIKNFTFTPEKNMKNNIPTEGYGKLYINGNYVSRIYSEYHFVKILPVGDNEIKVILSTNLDHDIANNGKVISDGIIYQFPEYTFSEARNKSYNQMIQCEFSETGKTLLNKLAKKNMAITESSEHLQCRHDARNDILGPFAKKMTRLQRYYHEVSLKTLKKRIQVWKDYENNAINLKQARDMNRRLENSVDKLMQDKLEQLEAAKKDV
tara:strand:- start:578 stop:1393 length:816 start_codon:yes stop_codon:yes gene_type:complete